MNFSGIPPSQASGSSNRMSQQFTNFTTNMNFMNARNGESKISSNMSLTSASDSREAIEMDTNQESSTFGDSSNQKANQFSESAMNKLVLTLLANALGTFQTIEGKRTSFRNCPFCKNSIGTNGGNFKKHCFTCCEVVSERLSHFANGAYFGGKKMIEDSNLISQGKNLLSENQVEKMLNVLCNPNNKRKQRKRKRDDGNQLDELSQEASRSATSTSPGPEKKRSDRRSGEPSTDNSRVNAQTESSAPPHQNPRYQALLNGAFIKSLPDNFSNKSEQEIMEETKHMSQLFSTLRMHCQTNFLRHFIKEAKKKSI